MVTDGKGKPAAIAAPDLHVLRQAAADGPFRPTLPPRATAIVCGRSTIVPAEHDDEVLALGIPFFIAEIGRNGRLAALELSGGRFRYRFIKGALKPNEVPLLQQRLDLFQDRSQRRPQDRP